jgi:hypothetical protein
LRGILLALEQWVVEDAAPPPSAFPRVADGSAMTPGAALAALAAIPGVVPPDLQHMRQFTRVDLGPAAADGVARYPIREGAPYATLVPALDADGNERAGIRLPLVSVPLATFTGWNPRDPSIGGAGQLIDLQGATVPFAQTRAAREATRDPRPSIAERYRDRADYLDRIRAAAEQLVVARYIVAEDVEVLVAQAGRVYDVLTSPA